MKFIYLFLLILNNCNQPSTLTKSLIESSDSGLKLYSPLPGELLHSGLNSFSTNKAPFILFLDKKPIICTQTPCSIEVNQTPFYQTYEVLDFDPQKGLPSRSAGYTKGLFFTQEIKLKNTINTSRPSSVLLPIKTKQGIYLDFYIYPGISKLENLELIIKGDLNFKYKPLKSKIPLIPSLPLNLNVKLIHTESEIIIEEFNISYSPSDLLELSF